jgi:hypothetical protein
VVLQPGPAFRLVDLRHAAAHRILAENLAHAEQGRVHRIAAERGDVRIAAMARQHRQQHGAEQVALGAGIRAGKRQGTVSYPGVEQSGLFEVVDEERQLPERRDRGRRIPLDVDPAGEGVRDR